MVCIRSFWEPEPCWGFMLRMDFSRSQVTYQAKAQWIFSCWGPLFLRYVPINVNVLMDKIWKIIYTTHWTGELVLPTIRQRLQMIMYFRQLSQFLHVPPPIRGPASELRGDGAQQTILGVGGWHPAEQPTSTRQLVQLVKGFTMVQTESSPGKMVDGNNIWCQKPWCLEHVHRKHVSEWLCYQMPSDFLQILSGLIPWTGQTDWGSTRIWFEHQ